MKISFDTFNNKGGTMFKGYNRYRNRIIRYMQRLNQLRPEFKETIEKARQYKVESQFINDASSLVNKISESYAGFSEYTREISHYIAQTEEFLQKWESKSITPGYAEVMRCARKRLRELKTFKTVLDETTEKAPDLGQEPNTGNVLGGILPVSAALIIGTVIILVVVVVLVLMQ